MLTIVYNVAITFIVICYACKRRKHINSIKEFLIIRMRQAGNIPDMTHFLFKIDARQHVKFVN